MKQLAIFQNRHKCEVFLSESNTELKLPHPGKRKGKPYPPAGDIKDYSGMLINDTDHQTKYGCIIDGECPPDLKVKLELHSIQYAIDNGWINNLQPWFPPE